MGLGIRPLKIKIVLESSPLKSTMLVGRLAVQPFADHSSEELESRLGPLPEAIADGGSATTTTTTTTINNNTNETNDNNNNTNTNAHAHTHTNTY